MPNTTDAQDFPTAKSVHPEETIPQGTVKPGSPNMAAHGPRDWNDVIAHNGEARGLADTAYSELQPDAPTVGAALRGHDIERDNQVHRGQIDSNNAPG